MPGIHLWDGVGVMDASPKPMSLATELPQRPRTNRPKKVEAPVVTPKSKPVDDGEVPAKTQAKRPKSSHTTEKLERLGRIARSVVSVASVVVALGIVALGGREAHQWLITTDRFAAREVVVVGNSRAKVEEIRRAAHLDESRNVMSIDCEVAARAIERLPWVRTAHVTRRLPGHVEVQIVERTAVATVSAGSMYLVDDSGTVFKRCLPGDPNDLPVLTGVERADFERDPESARETLRDALALLADVEASTVGTPMRVDEIHREQTGDLSMVVDGAHVWLGRGPYRAKLTRLRIVLRELERRGLRANEVHLETDRHPERVTVRTSRS
jgi:hypothetical protein